jgi:hypothetical protein
MTISIQPCGMEIILDNGKMEFVEFSESTNPLYEVLPFLEVRFTKIGMQFFPR